MICLVEGNIEREERGLRKTCLHDKRIQELVERKHSRKSDFLGSPLGSLGHSALSV